MFLPNAMFITFIHCCDRDGHGKSFRTAQTYIANTLLLYFAKFFVLSSFLYRYGDIFLQTFYLVFELCFLTFLFCFNVFLKLAVSLFSVFIRFKFSNKLLNIHKKAFSYLQIIYFRILPPLLFWKEWYLPFPLSISALETCANQFSAMFLVKAIVTAQSSLSSNYCLRVTAEGTNQNAQRPFFNTEIILKLYSLINI